MIPKFEHMQRIVKTGVIAVVRAESADEAIKIADAVRKGGIDLIEITFTVPGAIDVMKELAKNFSSDELLLGAGTVLDPETARAALLAGAEYIVSPYFNPEIVKLCNRYQKICMPGCMTVTEIVQAMEAGADIVKFFPGSAFGPSIVKAIKGPLPQAQIIPTGGVSLDNVQEWIKNGCLAVGVGGELTKGAKKGDFDLVTETAKRFVQKVKEARS
ncbi:MAG: bifunctional 2-keto-4-hydroxyglutarate aldolase/2-keto-3-deoxy-6-phosphogluconate aldolase [Dethiobacteria bacterium]